MRNQPPRLPRLAPCEVPAGQTLQLTVRAVDLDADPVRYTLVAGPANATLGAATGVLRWRPRDDQRGLHRLTIRATDPGGGSDQTTLQLRVE